MSHELWAQQPRLPILCHAFLKFDYHFFLSLELKSALSMYVGIKNTYLYIFFVLHYTDVLINFDTSLSNVIEAILK